MAIREVDWKRIKRTVKQIKKPLPSLSFWYSALWGAAVTLGATIIPLAYATGLPAWVIPAYGWGAACTALLGSLLYWLECKLIKRNREEASDILEDMDDIERHFQVVEPPSPIQKAG